MQRATPAPRRRSRLWIAPLVTLVPLLGALAGCGTHPTLDELYQVPGVSTQYPGSALYFNVPVPDEANLMVSNGAQLIEYRCAATSDTGRVADWFAAALDRQGWRSAPPLGTPTDPDITGHYEWRRGPRFFDLYFFTQRRSDGWARQAGKPTGCRGGYETVVQ